MASSFINNIKVQYPDSIVLVHINNGYYAYEDDADIIQSLFGSKIENHPFGRCAYVELEKKPLLLLRQHGYGYVIFDDGHVTLVYKPQAVLHQSLATLHPNAIPKESDIDYDYYLKEEKKTPDTAIVMESGIMESWYGIEKRYVVCNKGADILYQKQDPMIEHYKLFMDPKGYVWICSPYKYKLLDRLRFHGMKARLVP